MSIVSKVRHGMKKLADQSVAACGGKGPLSGYMNTIDTKFWKDELSVKERRDFYPRMSRTHVFCLFQDRNPYRHSPAVRQCPSTIQTRLHSANDECKFMPFFDNIMLFSVSHDHDSHRKRWTNNFRIFLRTHTRTCRSRNHTQILNFNTTDILGHHRRRSWHLCVVHLLVNLFHPSHNDCGRSIVWLKGMLSYANES